MSVLRSSMRAKGYVRCLILVSFSLFSSTLDADEPHRQGYGNFIARAVFGAGRLWLLTASGELSTIEPVQKARRNVPFPEVVLDVCAHEGQGSIVTCQRDACTKFTVHTWDESQWRSGPIVPTNQDHFIAYDCSTASNLILTNRRLVSLTGGDASAVPLSKEIDTGSLASIYADERQVFVGLNAGEWGGGLRRIDRKTGLVRKIARNVTGELCGGPLNSGCDPVNSVVGEPWRPDCVLTAIGLVHFYLPHGRLTEICGNTVKRFYSTTYQIRNSSTRLKGDKPFGTVAFYGLSVAKADVLAVGIDGLYRFHNRASPTIESLPTFEEIGGVGVSFELSDVVLVLTAINRRHSVGGNVPLLVPRE